MKATGIVRHIDELGRLVIPKEIRKNLRIREGDPIEIYTDSEGKIVLKKYSPMGEMVTFAKQFSEILAKNTGHKVVVSDRDSVIAVSGGMSKDYIGKKISKAFENIIQEREVVNTSKKGRPIPILEGETEFTGQQIIYPIMGDGEVIGSVVMMQKEGVGNLGDTEQKLVVVIAGFLGKQMEG